MDTTLTQVIRNWHYVEPFIKEPQNAEDHEWLIQQLDALLDIVRNNEDHPLIGLVDIISNHIEAYEEAHAPPRPKFDPKDMLQFLMEGHRLTQKDLPEVGSQGVVSEILSGKRKLNVRQIKALCKRFALTPETFMDDC